MSPAPEDPARPQQTSPDATPTVVLRRHAKPAPRRTAPTALVPLLVAAVAVVALWGAWQTLQRHGADAIEPARRASSDTAPGPTSPSPTTSPSTSPTTSPSASPSRSAPSAGTSTAPADGGSPDPRPPQTRPQWNRSVPVVVLNATSRTGLAAAVAGRLRARGWNVTAVGNWRGGGVARTTVFHVRHPRAVLTLIHDLPGAPRYRPMLPGMPRSGLVLVLAGDYPATR